MKHKSLFIITLIIFLIQISCTEEKREPVSYVNPYLGNISHLLVPTYPTVHLPNSMLRFYPDRDNFTTNKMSGFPLDVVSHRSGMVFSLMLFSGEIADSTIVPFTSDNESITPYCYKVTLDEQDIDLKFAPAGKAGFFNVCFNNGKERGIVIKTRNNGELNFTGNSVSGYDLSGRVKVYVYIEFDKTPSLSKLILNTRGAENQPGNTETLAISARFSQDNSKEINIRYGISFISAE